MSRKIGIDARFIGPGGTGLGKYTEKLILNLAQIDSINQYLIFLRENNWQYLNLNSFKNFTKVLADVPWYSFSEQFKMNAVFAVQNLDLLHVPHFNVPIFYRGKFVVTIHDLIHHKFTEYAATTKNPFFFKIKRLGYKRVIANAVYKSQRIITPSNFVKNDILKNFKVSSAKIAVTYEAAEEEYFRKISNFATLDLVNTSSRISNLAKSGGFLLYVGNAYPHKNLNRLLDALKLLITHYQPPSLNLIIVCPRGVFQQRLKEEIAKRYLTKVIKIKGYLEPKNLAKLFQKASAYVFPSLSEGFGITGLNAMASGLPVVCSDIPVLKEIYSDAAVYFNPNNEKDIAAKIKKVLSDPKTRSVLIRNGIEQASKYSWQKMAQQTLKIYESI